MDYKLGRDLSGVLRGARGMALTIEGVRMTILIVLAFLAGAVADHYFEAKFRAWLAAKAAEVKAKL